MSIRHVLALTLLLGLSACGSSPTAPTPTASTPSPVFVFVPDSNSPAARAFVLTDAGETAPGRIALAVRANDFAAGFSMFRGTIVFDPHLLSLLNFTRGDFLEQGGGLVTYDISGTGTNQARLRIDRPSSLSPATGSGTVVIVRFALATTTARGSSPFQWDDTNAYTPSFSDVLARTYGGVVTVQ